MEHELLTIKMTLDYFKKYCLEYEDYDITEKQFEKWIELFTYDNDNGFYDRVYEMMADDLREKMNYGELDDSSDEESEEEGLKQIGWLPQTTIGECEGCPAICGECERLVIVEDEEIYWKRMEEKNGKEWKKRMEEKNKLLKGLNIAPDSDMAKRIIVEDGDEWLKEGIENLNKNK